jgi:hypothetical protein
MIKYCFAVLLCTGALNLHAQFETPNIPPSPNSAGLVRSANIQVGHYTGVPSISIPLGALGGKGVSMPVSLDYHASGIKVQDVASSVGLGFNLVAGGAITRVVRGLPDFSKAFCSIGPGSFNSQYGEFCDGEKDLFYFSIPGRSGKMFFDNGGSVSTMPWQDIIIKPGIGPLSLGHWTITDENGYVYYFGESPSSVEQTTYYIGDNTAYTQKYTYTSTWYLNKIMSPANEEVASITYDTGSDFEYIIYNQTGVKPTSGTISVKTANTKIKVNQAKYVNRISTSIGRVYFEYVFTRDDLPNARQLKSVTYKDLNDNNLKKYHLSLDYFTTEWNDKRLRLASVREGLNNPITTHAFSYYDVYSSTGQSLSPGRDSFYYDHYGYFNGPTPSCSPTYRLPLGCTNFGSNRSSNPTTVNVYSLKEITNATGGKSIFQYESSNGRGLRIGSISTLNVGTTPVAKSTFTYSGGASFGTPVYNYEAYDGSIIWSSSSFTDLFDVNGTSVGYPIVTETFLDGSKVVREFTTYSDEAPVVQKYLAFPPTTIPTFVSVSDVNGPPFTSTTTRFWMRGLPRFIKIYDSNNNLLTVEEMQYEEGISQSTVQSQALHGYQQAFGSNPKRTYISGVYNLYSKPLYLKKKIVTAYNQADFTKSFVQTTDYTYHTYWLTFPTSIITTTGPETLTGRPQQKVTFRYPTDVSGFGSEPASPQPLAAGVWALKNKHIVTPIEKLSYLKDWGAPAFNLVGGELFTFNKAGAGQPYVSGVYGLTLSNPISNLTTEATLTSSGSVFNYDNTNYSQLSTYSYDDAKKVVGSVTDNQGITTKYNWESNNTLLASSSLLVNSQEKYVTQYTYTPSKAVEQVIDMNNIATRYSYDNMGRLKLIKDNAGNILTRYRYNYGNNIEFASDFTISKTSAPTGQLISFSSLYNSENTGVTRYVWDFGDGQVLEGAAPIVSHTYSRSGTFTVKLSKINPEYGTVTQTKTLSIYPLPTVSITTSRTSINLCVSPTSTTLQATGSGGCSPLTYNWYSSKNGGGWINIGSGATLTWYPSEIGSFQVKCVVNDNISTCGNSTESSPKTISVIKSPSTCAQP